MSHPVDLNRGVQRTRSKREVASSKIYERQNCAMNHSGIKFAKLGINFAKKIVAWPAWPPLLKCFIFAL